MERSSFFNAISANGNYDRIYKAEDFARYFASFIGTGVFATPATNLQVTSTDTMNLTLKQGKAWINGYFYENTEDLTLTVEVADGTLNRIDRVVIRLDLVNREIKCYVKKGSFATSPVAPELTRNSDIYEIGLADIRVNKGVTKIVQDDITDLRQNNNFCGLVAGVVQQIDTTNLFTQFESAFNTWFDDIKGQLGDDVAGNLQDQITELSNNKVDKVPGKGLSSNDYTTEEKNKLAGIAEGANNYTHPDTHSATIITQDATHRFVTDDEKSKWNSLFTATKTEIKLAGSLAFASGYTNAIYLSKDGIVTINFGVRFYIENSNGLVTGQTLFTLPTNLRPKQGIIIPALAVRVGLAKSIGYIYVRETGVVVFELVGDQTAYSQVCGTIVYSVN